MSLILDGSEGIILATGTSLTGNVTGSLTGFVEASALVTTYKDHSADAYQDANIVSHINSYDNWIYLDQASAQWGLYYRQDSTLVVDGEMDLPGNSIAFIGNNNLKAYICLAERGC